MTDRESPALSEEMERDFGLLANGLARGSRSVEEAISYGKAISRLRKALEEAQWNAIQEMAGYLEELADKCIGQCAQELRRKAATLRGRT